MNKLDKVVADCNESLVLLKDASVTIRVQVQRVTVNLLWLVENGHFEAIYPIVHNMIDSLDNVKTKTLTLQERRTFKLFTSQHLPVAVDKDNVVSACNDAKKKQTKTMRKVFKDKYDCDYWAWAKDKAIVQKAKDWKGLIAKNIKLALEDEKDGITSAEIVRAVFDGGMVVSDFVAFLEPPKQEVVVVRTPEQVSKDNQALINVAA